MKPMFRSSTIYPAPLLLLAVGLITIFSQDASPARAASWNEQAEAIERQLSAYSERGVRDGQTIPILEFTSTYCLGRFTKNELDQTPGKFRSWAAAFGEVSSVEPAEGNEPGIAISVEGETSILFEQNTMVGDEIQRSNEQTESATIPYPADPKDVPKVIELLSELARVCRR